jgi:phage gpG-like protein
MSVSNQITKEINKILAKFEKKAKKVDKATLALAADIIEESIQENFAVGGRWSGSGTDLFDGGTRKWEQIKTSTKRQLKSRGVSDYSPLSRRSTTGLAERTFVKAGSNKLEIVSQKKYAVAHQFGAVINHPGGTPYGFAKDGSIRFLKKTATKYIGKTKPHQIKIPARPFIVIQPEDMDIIVELISENILSG